MLSAIELCRLKVMCSTHRIIDMNARLMMCRIIEEGAENF